MALSLFDQAQAIVWAQWRTIFNHYPRANKWSSGFMPSRSVTITVLPMDKSGRDISTRSIRRTLCGVCQRRPVRADLARGGRLVPAFPP